MIKRKFYYFNDDTDREIREEIIHKKVFTVMKLNQELNRSGYLYLCIDGTTFDESFNRPDNIGDKLLDISEIIFKASNLTFGSNNEKIDEKNACFSLRFMYNYKFRESSENFYIINLIYTRVNIATEIYTLVLDSETAYNKIIEALDDCDFTKSLLVNSFNSTKHSEALVRIMDYTESLSDYILYISNHYRSKVYLNDIGLLKPSFSNLNSYFNYIQTPHNGTFGILKDSNVRFGDIIFPRSFLGFKIKLKPLYLIEQNEQRYYHRFIYPSGEFIKIDSLLGNSNRENDIILTSGFNEITYRGGYIL